jgi:hypothetical protein
MQGSKKRQISPPRTIKCFIKHITLATFKIELFDFWDFDVFIGQARWNWVCLPRMHDLENAELGMSMISQPRSCVYCLLIRLINGFVDNHPFFFLPGMQSNTSPWINNVFLHVSPSARLNNLMVWSVSGGCLLPHGIWSYPKSRFCRCMVSLALHSSLYYSVCCFCIRITFNTLLTLFAIQGKFWVFE